jgi:uncharacterized phosphosugar-binding protein
VSTLLKIFTTQLVGYFNAIQEKEEMNIEDSSRAIAQALVGDGTVYFHGYDAMMAICYEAVHGQEKLPKASFFIKDGKEAALSSIDRLIIAAPSSDNIEAISLAKKAKEQGAIVIGLSYVNEESTGVSLQNICDFHINTHLHQPLVPTDFGEKIATPSVMTTLYCYYALYLTTTEIISEYN